MSCHVADKVSSSHSDSESDSFEEKLAREMEDEYGAHWGIYEEGITEYIFFCKLLPSDTCMLMIKN